MRLFLRILIIGLLALSQLPSLPVAAADTPPQVIRVKGTVWYVASMDLYAIMGLDGKKYHPTKKLPREYQKEGTELVVEGKIRDDLTATKLWGQPFEIVKITKADQYTAPEDRETLRLLLLRMDAFNTKNLDKLQAIDVMASGLTAEQFNSWIGSYDRFTLQYFETTATTHPVIMGSPITGMCLYARERLNSIALSGNIQYTLMSFTLTKNPDGWKFTSIGPYTPEGDVDMDKFVDELLKKTKDKYGTTNLAAWKG
ncbi:MAG: hypothetical protein P4N59_19095 [Negativicutes bacterium]|nr:hypothetical protein [Negativicutes bacterium]